MVLGTNQITTGGTLPIDCTNQSAGHKEKQSTKLTSGKGCGTKQAGSKGESQKAALTDNTKAAPTTATNVAKLTTPEYKLSGSLIYGSICKTGFLNGLPRHRYLEITGSDEKGLDHFKDHFSSYTLDEIQVFLEPVGLELVLIKKCRLPEEAGLPGKYISFCEKIGGGNMTGGELLEYFTKKGVEIQLRSRSVC